MYQKKAFNRREQDYAMGLRRKLEEAEAMLQHLAPSRARSLALTKLDEEVGELHQAVREDANVAEELGDVLFAAVKAARFAGVDPEDALNAACEKFIRRYAAVEQGAAGRGVPVSDLTLAEMTDLWNGAKQRHDSDGF